ncbi:unnamed protein product [Linum tenue]|uniref:Uncharacterized protein n=1 Tax=Linum tenue TaxID=586396 RepID=A0AAV0LRP7_9ROSI|nr:unnamed protein product [Linum tenue]
MEKGSPSSALQSLLEAIKASDVVEKRIQLLAKLEDLDLREESDSASLVECLATFWEDYTCLDVSQCMLNKTIVHVAVKFASPASSDCLPQFLALSTKASSWCRKHLKMTLMSTQDSQEEEHSQLFFQLLLELLRLSTANILSLTKYPLLSSKESVDIVEKFILELLNLIKDVVPEIKRINSLGSEVLKVAQTSIDALINLCKRYFQIINENLSDARLKDSSVIASEVVSVKDHVLTITKHMVEKLCELGSLAASDGGSLVTILNVSWKGVVTLLQLGKEVITQRVNVQDIIRTLTSLVNGHLKCATEAWSSTQETVSVAESRRTFLPVKFYLLNAAKISSLYPCQACLVYRELMFCILLISTFRISLCYEKNLKNASEVCSELLDKTYLDLLSSILSSAEVNPELKLELLNWLFNDECGAVSEERDPTTYYNIGLMIEIFAVSCEAVPRSSLLLLGRVALFHSLLSHSVGFEEDVKIKITRKLDWFLDVMVNKDIYSYVLTLQIPVVNGTGQKLELNWQSMFSVLLDSIKTFMIVSYSSVAWEEFEDFLVENICHPHFLCREIIMELWCFLVRHAEEEVAKALICKLCIVMKLIADPASLGFPTSLLRKMARAICLLLTNGTASTADHVYSFIADDTGSHSLMVIYSALLLEGFPLNLLPENVRTMAKQKIITDYFGFIESFDESLLPVTSSNAFGTPVIAICASLQSQQVSMSDVDLKTLKFIIKIIQNLKHPKGKSTKECCFMLLNVALEIVSAMKHLYQSDEMEKVVMELHGLFISGPTASDSHLHQCKPHLALFMGGLGDMQMSESDDCAKSTAVWELYHMMLKERHWALVHLAIASFGYFAARTSCNQLWRFVPQNATLSYDVISASEASEERFMSELKAFLEKEVAVLATITASSHQHELLVKEGTVLREMVQKISNTCIEEEVTESDGLGSNVDSQCSKRRKLPDGISRGVELIQNGLKFIGDGLSQWQQNHNVESTELQEKFLTHFSRLEDVVSHLSGLAGSG